MEIRAVGPQLSSSGVILSGRTLFNRQDYNPDLTGQNGTNYYEKMRRDPAIAGHLARWKSHVQAANWTFEPPEDWKGSAKVLDTMMELCNRYIMGDGRDHIQDTFKGGLLPHILLMLDFGMSAVEKVWGIDEQGRHAYARLAPILPWTVQEFELGENGELLRLVQYAYVAGGIKARQEVPEAGFGTADEKIAVFTYRQEGDNYFGRPVLRECFQPWWHKSELWTLDGLQKELGGMGFRVVKIPDSIVDTTSDIYKTAQQIAFDSRSSETGGAVIGQNWEFDVKFPTGTPPDIQGSMEFCNRQIAAAFNDQQSQYGTTPNGTKSLGETQTNSSMLSDQEVADLIEMQINTQLVPILCRRNVGPQEEWPKIQCEDLDKMTGTDAATNAKTLSDAGILRYDRVLEEHFRETLDLPAIDDATREDPPVPAVVAPDGAAPDTQGAANQAMPEMRPQGAPSKPAAKAAAVDYAQPAMPRVFHRDPHAHEAHVDFQEIANYLDTQPGRVAERTVVPFRRLIVARLAKAASNATGTALASGQAFEATAQSIRSRMVAELNAELLAVYRKGRTDVLAERDRQIKRAADSSEDEDLVDEAYAKPSEMKWIKIMVGLAFVSSMFNALKDEAKTAAITALNANMTPQEVEHRTLLALSGLSQKEWTADLAGSIARSYATGRTDQGAAMSDQVSSVFYSAVMDSGTCGPCMARDGQEMDMGSVDSMVPNPDCEGGDRCRCEAVFVFRSEAA
jgi:hypothetical protein